MKSLVWPQWKFREKDFLIPVINKSLTERTFSGFVWLFSSEAVSSILRFFVMIVLARLLGPSEFGLFGAALIVISFAQLFVTLGIGPAIVQRTSLNQRHVRVGYTLSMALGVAFTTAVFMLAPWIAGFFRMPELDRLVQVLSFLFLINSLSVVSRAQLEREMRFALLAKVHILVYLVGHGIIAVTLAFSGWGVWALVYGHMVGALLSGTVFLTIKRASFGFSLAREETRHILNFGLGFSLGRIANHAATQADNVIVGRMLGQEALGLYGRAYGFLMMPASMLGSLANQVLFPAMASVQNEKHRLRVAYNHVLKAIIMLTLPASGILILLAPELILVILGSQWLAMVIPFQILIVVLVFRVAYKISDTLARATGAVYKRAWRQLIYASCVVGGALIGQHWGLAGVATGVAVAVLINFLLMFQLSATLVDVKWSEMGSTFLRHSIVTAISCGGAATAIVTLRVHDASPYLTLTAGSAAFALAILFLWMGVRRVFGEEGQWIESNIRQYGAKIRAANTAAV